MHLDVHNRDFREKMIRYLAEMLKRGWRFTSRFSTGPRKDLHGSQPDLVVEIRMNL